MLTPVDISAGLVSTADDMSPATSKLVNWQPDVAGILRMRPQLKQFVTTVDDSSFFNAIGLYQWKNWLVAVGDNRKVYALDSASPTVWTSLSDGTAATQVTGSERPTFAESPSYLYIAGGGPIQKWTGAGLTARLGGTSPNTTHIINIAQRLVARDMANPGRYLYSDLGEGNDSTWGPLSFITAESRPDDLAAIKENIAEIALFGTSTMEIHGISTDPLVPFQRLNTLSIGCSAAHSIVSIDGVYHWLDDRRRLVRGDGRSYEVFGEAIQRDLRELSEVSDAVGYREDTKRNNCLVWNFPTAGRSWAYDVGAKKWTERGFWDSASAANGAWDITAHAFWDAINANVVHVDGGRLVSVLDTENVGVSDDFALAELVTGWQDFGTDNRKRSARVRVVMRRGTTPLGSTSGQLEVAVEDDGKGFTPFRVIDLGQPYDTNPSIDCHFGGVFRRRRYWLRYSGTDDMSLAKLADDVTDLEAAA